MHLNHPFILCSIIFKGDVLFGSGADDEDAPAVAGGGLAEGGFTKAALLLAYVILVMGPRRGGTIFSLLGPFILVASTNLVTSAGYRM